MEIKDLKNADNYLDKFKNENTKLAAITLLNKLSRYVYNDLDYINNIQPEEIDLFIKKECTGKSETTISNVISRIKDVCSFYNNESANHLSLDYVKSITEIKNGKYLTPNEINNIIKKLLNYQDKALVLLTYIGLYDNNFETIRNLRADQFTNKNSILLDNGKEIKLNQYCAEIIYGAIKETSCVKYVFSEGRESKPYYLRETKYIMKSKERKDVDLDIVPSITLKKRFDIFGKVAEVDGLSAIVIKNSKYIYDLVKLEYDINGGLDINQVELKNYCKETNMRGTIEKLNISKKEIKTKIIREILEKKDFLSEDYEDDFRL